MRRYTFTLIGVLLVVSAAWSQDADEKRLAAALRDGSYKVRLQAAIIIGKKNLSRLAEPLRGLLADENDAVRAAAAVSLGKLAHQPARADIAALLAHENPLVSRAAEKALQALDKALGQPVYFLVLEKPQGSKGVPPFAAVKLGELLRERFSRSRALVLSAGEERVLQGKQLSQHLERRGLTGMLVRPRLSGMQERYDGSQTVMEGKVDLLVIALAKMRLEFSASGEANAWIEGGDISDSNREELSATVLESAVQAAVKQVLQYLQGRGT